MTFPYKKKGLSSFFFSVGGGGVLLIFGVFTLFLLFSLSYLLFEQIPYLAFMVMNNEDDFIDLSSSLFISEYRRIQICGL